MRKMSGDRSKVRGLVGCGRIEGGRAGIVYVAVVVLMGSRERGVRVRVSERIEMVSVDGVSIC